MISPSTARTIFTAPEGLVLQLLAWIAERPRTYGETMDAWRTSCPRMPVWEDALTNGLIRVVDGASGLLGQRIELTSEGRSLLDERT
ncbi:MAG: hypothetical protein ABSC94_32875 [Polyangiaceae bacterium]|jgi:hypothetical protein